MTGASPSTPQMNRARVGMNFRPSFYSTVVRIGGEFLQGLPDDPLILRSLFLAKLLQCEIECV